MAQKGWEARRDSLPSPVRAKQTQQKSEDAKLASLKDEEVFSSNHLTI